MFSRTVIFLPLPLTLSMLTNYIKYLLSCEQIPSHNSEAWGEYVTLSSHGLEFHCPLRIPLLSLVAPPRPVVKLLEYK